MPPIVKRIDGKFLTCEVNNIMSIEEWRSIPNFIDYEVSSFGRVRSIDRIVIQNHPRFKTGIQYRNFKSKFLRPSIVSDKGKNPHYYLTLRKDKKSYKFLIHRLVLMAFIGNCPEGFEGCHNDGNGLNNKLDNLRWDSPSKNQLDRYKHGTGWTPHYKGENHPSSKLTEKDILYIRSIKKYRKRALDLSREFNISKSSIHQIIAGRSWKHVKGRCDTD